MRGKFISFEGGEGSGKTTQLKLLTAAFEKVNLPFISTREPGGTPSSERIRNLLVSGAGDAWGHLSETLLFQAARAEHIEKLIAPAINAKKTVLCDRFVDSTVVYQGIAKNLGLEYIKSMHRFIFGNFMPDLTILLDIAPEQGLLRAATRNHNETRFEGLEIDFHKQIRAGFLQIANNEPQRFCVLDARQPPDELHSQIIKIIRDKFGLFME
jgi:dTMP kinase